MVALIKWCLWLTHHLTWVQGKQLHKYNGSFYLSNVSKLIMIKFQVAHACLGLYRHISKNPECKKMLDVWEYQGWTKQICVPLQCLYNDSFLEKRRQLLKPKITPSCWHCKKKQMEVSYPHIQCRMQATPKFHLIQ